MDFKLIKKLGRVLSANKDIKPTTSSQPVIQISYKPTFQDFLDDLRLEQQETM